MRMGRLEIVILIACILGVVAAASLFSVAEGY